MLLDCVFSPFPILLCSYLCLEQFIPLPEGCPQGYIGVGGRGDDGLYAHCTGGAHRVIDISFLLLLLSMASFIESTMLSLAASTYTNLLLASLSTTATMWIPKAFLALWMLLFLPILVLLYVIRLLSVYWIDHLFHCSLQGLQEGRMEISQCLSWPRSFLHSSCLLSL